VLSGSYWDVEPDLVTIDTGASTPIPIPSTALSNGRGAVAYPTDTNASGDGHFAVWNAKSAVDGLAGTPVAWTSDGSRLAVWHWAQPAQGATGARPSGWLEVISWPDHQQLYADRSIRSDTQVEFDPTGRYLLFSAASGPFTIADTTSGHLTPLPVQCCSVPAWDDQSRVLVADDGMTVRTFDTAGAEVDSLPSAGESVTATPDGRVVAAWFSEANIGIDTGRLTVIRDGSPQVFPLPGADRYPVQFLAISPDGTRIAAICETDEGAAVLLLPLD
jgi:WD40 repeat protein